MPRRLAFPFALVVAVLGCARPSWSSPTQAVYRLYNADPSLGSAPLITPNTFADKLDSQGKPIIGPDGAAEQKEVYVPEAVFRVRPSGGVLPVDPVVGPLRILPDSSGFVSSGFDRDAVHALLGGLTTSSGDPAQVLGIDFGPGGFKPQGAMYFALDLDPAFNGLVDLILPTQAGSYLAVERLEGVTYDFSQAGSGPGTQVPEPAAILLWAGGALIGIRHLRRRRRAS